MKLDKEIRKIFADFLKEYLERLKEYEKRNEPFASSYNEGYYDGFQKAIDLIKN